MTIIIQTKFLVCSQAKIVKDQYILRNTKDYLVSRTMEHPRCEMDFENANHFLPKLTLNKFFARNLSTWWEEKRSLSPEVSSIPLGKIKNQTFKLVCRL